MFSISLMVFMAVVSFAHGEDFLKTKTGLDDEFQAAMGAIMGCTSGSDEHHTDMASIERALTPMWRALPKNSHGRVEWRMVRYVTHRFFMQRYSLLIRGFEPAQQESSTSGILGEQVPSLLDSIVLGKHNDKGFLLSDAAVVVAAIERLIFDSETKLLKTVYRKRDQPLSGSVEHKDLAEIMQVYLLHWLIDDEQGVNDLMQNATFREQVIPQWKDLRDFAFGVVKSMEFKRQRAPLPGHGQVAMTQRYSFDDAHEAVGGLTKTFASYWDNECRQIKSGLVALDTRRTGRVRLADFYGANLDGQWQFGESEAYLRDLGALDESSASIGPQVIIPNYIQGASNCVVSTPHYLVCCVNECEDYLNRIEDEVGASVATPARIVELVSSMASEDDEPIRVSKTLNTQLLRIADIHGGRVPLHGRLFSQWLHYIFPRDCPFPHKAGSVNNTVHMNDYGYDSVASAEEVRQHASGRNLTRLEGGLAEAQWMTQWSEDEELPADYAIDLRAPWEVSGTSLVQTCILLMGVVLVVSGAVTGHGKTVLLRDAVGDHKAHLV